MDIGKAFGQMFKDPQWVKKLIFYVLFSFLSVFLVGIPFVVGYTVLVLHNYMQGKEELPEWEGNWELILMTGLKSIGITIVFGMVGAIIAGCTVGVLRILSVIFENIEGLEMIGLLLTLIQTGVSSVLGAVFLLISFMIKIRFAKHLSFSEVFDFDWYIGFFKKSWKNLLLVWLLFSVTNSISSLGLFALCIGVFLTAFYAMVVNAALLSELAKAAGETSALSVSSVAESGSTVSAQPVVVADVSAKVVEE